MNSWQALVLDALVIVCLTLLGAMKIAPIEAVLGLLGTFVGARAMQRYSGKGPGDPPGPSAAASTVALLALSAWSAGALRPPS